MIDGKGIVSIVRLTDIQDRPKLLQHLHVADVGRDLRHLPEEGDPELPKLVMFIDEAHLIFDEASKPLRDQIETIIKLIRSKGVGIFLSPRTPPYSGRCSVNWD